MATVGQWTGREASTLRRALRLSVRDFAEHLSVAQRTISKWEALGTETRPNPDSQALLDTALSRAGDDGRARFVALLDEETHSPLRRFVAASPGVGERETWEEDLDRVVVSISRQSFSAAERLLNRWLVQYDPAELDERGRYLHGRSLALLGDVRRDRGQISGFSSAQQSYQRAFSVFEDLDIPRRMAQIELSLVVVVEMSEHLDAAARRYETLATDERLSDRDRARATLWVGTALDKAGEHDHATRLMLTATRCFESLNEPDDWSVAHQKLALAHRGTGDLDRALQCIDIARSNSVLDTPMQRVRIDTAQAHILLTDQATTDSGFALLSEARHISTQYGLAHQLASIDGIRRQFEQAQ